MVPKWSQNLFKIEPGGALDATWEPPLKQDASNNFQIDFMCYNMCKETTKGLNILELEADQLSEYCREFGLYYERSDKGMPKFDYEN